ncbi:MAG: hypothetical protein QG621_369 [Patescibacteria group bacterium]|jgi:hypothetical protein|nr:hypothetical protein [Patescibacteria group bacterium]
MRRLLVPLLLILGLFATVQQARAVTYDIIGLDPNPSLVGRAYINGIGASPPGDALFGTYTIGELRPIGGGPSMFGLYANCIDPTTWGVSSPVVAVSVDDIFSAAVALRLTIAKENMPAPTTALISGAEEIFLLREIYGAAITFTGIDPAAFALADTFDWNITHGIWVDDPTKEVVALTPTATSTQRLLVVVPVPEPLTIAWLGGALILLGLMNQYRRMPSLFMGFSGQKSAGPQQDVEIQSIF